MDGFVRMDASEVAEVCRLGEQRSQESLEDFKLKRYERDLQKWGASRWVRFITWLTGKRPKIPTMESFDEGGFGWSLERDDVPYRFRTDIEHLQRIGRAATLALRAGGHGVIYVTIRDSSLLLEMSEKAGRGVSVLRAAEGTEI